MITLTPALGTVPRSPISFPTPTCLHASTRVVLRDAGLDDGTPQVRRVEYFVERPHDDAMGEPAWHVVVDDQQKLEALLALLEQFRARVEDVEQNWRKTRMQATQFERERDHFERAAAPTSPSMRAQVNKMAAPWIVRARSAERLIGSAMQLLVEAALPVRFEEQLHALRGAVTAHNACARAACDPAPLKEAKPDAVHGPVNLQAPAPPDATATTKGRADLAYAAPGYHGIADGHEPRLHGVELLPALHAAEFQARELCLLVENLPASRLQTECSTRASNLRRGLAQLAHGNPDQTVGPARLSESLIAIAREQAAGAGGEIERRDDLRPRPADDVPPRFVFELRQGSKAQQVLLAALDRYAVDAAAVGADVDGRIARSLAATLGR